MSTPSSQSVTDHWRSVLARFEKRGARVGKYSIQQRIGSGGMGRVYRASDTELSREVALKTLHEMSPANLLRFKREFRAVADLVHENLVQLHELFSDGELWLLSMELIDGVPFTDWVLAPLSGDRPVPPRRNPETEATRFLSVTATAVALGAATSPPPSSGSRQGIPIAPENEVRLRNALVQLLEAVAELHRGGIVHRDLKPANVLVDGAGRVVVLDFGVVGSAEAEVGSLFLGTPAYAAPEMLRGIAVPASDIYGVGCMLYECLTGLLPFEGTATQVLRAKEMEEPEPPQLIAKGIAKDLAELCQAMLERAPVRRPTAETALRLLGRESMAGRQRTAFFDRGAAGFVGRSADLAALDQGLTRARSGTPSAMFFVGPSGAGKTRLLEEFLKTTRAAQRAGEPRSTNDLIVLRGRCYEFESVPFKALDPIVDALASLVVGATRKRLQALPARDFAELRAMFPVLFSLPVDADKHDSLPPPADVEIVASAFERKRRAGAAFAALLQLLSERATVVLWIDDLQWGDRDSADLLIEALTLAHSMRLILFCTYREEGTTGAFVKELSQGLTKTKIVRVEHRTLEPLSTQETEQLLRAQSKTILADEDVRKLATEAGGNPYLVEAISRHATNASAGERFSLERAFSSTLARMPDSDRRLLETACVAGRPLAAPLLARATRVEGADAALARLRAEKLVKGFSAESGNLVEPYHDRVRQVISGLLTPEHRRRILLSIGEALLESAPRAHDMLADYFFFGGDFTQADRHARLAVGQAVRALAFDRAAELYRRILESPSTRDPAERRELTIALAEALVSAGRCAEATPHYLVAADGAHPELRRDLQRRAAEQRLVSGELEAGVAAIRPVLRELGMEYPATSRQAITRLVASVAWLELWGLRSLPGLGRQSDVERADVCWSAGKGLISSDSVRGGSFMLESLRYSLRAGDEVRTARGLAIYAMIRMYEGNASGVARGKVIFERAWEVARRLGNTYIRGVVLCTRGTAEMALGQFRVGLERMERGIELLREHGVGVTWEINTTVSSLFNARIWMGLYAEVADRLPRWQREAEQVANGFAVVQGEIYQANVDLAQGKPDVALARARDAATIWRHEAPTFQSWLALRTSLHSKLLLGDVRAARHELDGAWDQLDKSGLLRVHIMHVDAWLMRATILAAESAAGGRRNVRAMKTIAHKLGNDPKPLARACSFLVLAQAEELEGRADRARKSYRAAHDMFASMEVAAHSAAAAWALARFDGDARQHEALAAGLVARGITDPERFLNMLAPVAAPLR